MRDVQRWLPWVSGVVWIGSWRIVYLEIFRWRHLTRTLRFNPPPGSNARPGLPVKLLRVAAIAAPVVFVTTMARARRGSRRVQ